MEGIILCVCASCDCHVMRVPVLCDSHVMRTLFSTDYHVTHVLLLSQTRVCVCPCSEMLMKPSSFTD